MKKRTISLDDLPEEVMDFTRGQPSSLQDKVYEHIKKHPKCTRRDLYLLDSNDGHIRAAITAMLKSTRIRETFTIQ